MNRVINQAAGAARRRRAITAAVAAAAVTPAAAASFQYAYDDGVSNITAGPAGFDADVLWGNYFTAQPGAETITTIRFGFGGWGDGIGSPTPPVTVYLFEDADDDFDPTTNTLPIASVTTSATDTGLSGFIDVDLPTPTTVSGGFFVAVRTFARDGLDLVTRRDPDARADRSWLFYDGSISPNNLGGSPFILPLDTPGVPFPGAFNIRAIGVPTPGTVALGALALGLVVAPTGRRRTR